MQHHGAITLAQISNPSKMTWTWPFQLIYLWAGLGKLHPAPGVWRTVSRGCHGKIPGGEVKKHGFSFVATKWPWTSFSSSLKGRNLKRGRGSRIISKFSSSLKNRGTTSHGKRWAITVVPSSQGGDSLRSSHPQRGGPLEKENSLLHPPVTSQEDRLTCQRWWCGCNAGRRSQTGVGLTNQQRRRACQLTREGRSLVKFSAQFSKQKQQKMKGLSH